MNRTNRPLCELRKNVMLYYDCFQLLFSDVDFVSGKRHSTVPRGTCLRRGAVGLAGTGTSARHRGHVGRRRSQASTQRAWKACGQQGSARTVSPSSTAPRHTAHSAAAAAALPPRRGGSTKQGSRAMAAESRPPPDDEPPIPAPDRRLELAQAVDQVVRVEHRGVPQDDDGEGEHHELQRQPVVVLADQCAHNFNAVHGAHRRHYDKHVSPRHATVVSAAGGEREPRNRERQ
ncbi:hypothetical protein OsJ_15709 [Oryza sativa Japonica Group]|uniref:Uncharacterized protein n=1 Tax=Oryza sativa subsp. japonica TaxID=39947 RepID=B9FGH5_ORYSJ|nr:hypothetical protein OsJ_15709 [Oryza sativa Japonica Group]